MGRRPQDGENSSLPVPPISKMPTACVWCAHGLQHCIVACLGGVGKFSSAEARCMHMGSTEPFVYRYQVSTHLKSSLGLLS